jgi:hypothetical protein
MSRLRQLTFACTTAAVIGLAVPRAGGAPERLVFHDIQVDAAGRILPWYSPKPSVAYDHAIRAVWRFWQGMPMCPNDVRYFLQHQVWKPGAEDPRGLGGDQLAMALSSWNLLHGYLGDPAIVTNMRYVADYYLAHGLSPPASKWPDLPFPYNVDVHSGRFDGDMRAGRGFLQPDKAGSFGAELVTLAKVTGDTRYLAAAARMADTLAAQVVAGDAEHSPWPYRVHVDGRTTPADPKTWTTYTANWTGALRLFEALKPFGRGETAQHDRAHALVRAWLAAYPMQTNDWGPFFEDIVEYSNTAINAGTMAQYLMEEPRRDPEWQAHTRGILDWVERTFANDEFTAVGVTPINEQTAYKVPGNSHTARHAALELMYAARTGVWSRKDQQIRRLNWATYMVDADGRNQYPRDDVWLTDGYGDYVRHYLRAMAASPDLAPDDQNHLLDTSSVIQAIQYTPDRITYTKFDPVSIDRLKVGAWTPGLVTGGLLRWDRSTRVAEIAAGSTSVTIERAR